MWNNILNLGGEHQGEALIITEDMAGDNQWTCIANNSIDGKYYHVARKINFKAGMYYNLIS